MILAGRGWGKTNTGAEETAYRASFPNQRIAIVAPTFSAARDVCVEGSSGLLACLPPDIYSDWNRSLGELRFRNGTIVKLYSADTPDRLRGPQHHFAWCDEITSFRYLPAVGDHNPWDNLMFGLRLGAAQCVSTTTPKPLTKLKKIIANPMTITTHGTTYDNLSNLAPSFREALLEYEGTSLGEQELLGRLLDDMPGALWTNALIEKYRVQQMPELQSIVIAVDPSTTDAEGADEAGIVAAGLGIDWHVYLMEDASGLMMPSKWGARTRELFERWGASYIVAEKNQGGEMVRDTINGSAGQKLPVQLVHAKQGKKARAEPVQMLYEQGKVHHVGTLPLLESQMTTWQPHMSKTSPDRIDAMVYAVTKLLVKPTSVPSVGGVALRRSDTYA